VAVTIATLVGIFKQAAGMAVIIAMLVGILEGEGERGQAAGIAVTITMLVGIFMQAAGMAVTMLHGHTSHWQIDCCQESCH
jgi:hypothetical protein